MNKQEFYEEVEYILNSGHEYKEAWINNRRSGRWGPREPGNGRFKGFGLVRWFNEDLVTINLYHPYPVNYRCEDYAALTYLTSLMTCYIIDQHAEGLYERNLSINSLFED